MYHFLFLRPPRQSSLKFSIHNLVFPFQIGDIQTSYNSVKKSLENFPEHAEGKSLLAELQRKLSAI